MSNHGWSWSLRFVVALAVAAAMWAGTATFALETLHQRVSARQAAPASHR